MTETVPPAAGRWRPDGLCAFFLCDIARFSDASRVDPVRIKVREAMYDGIEQSLAGVGLSPPEWYQEDRGDGVMVVLPPKVSMESLLTTVVARLRAAVRHHNAAASAAARLRLRVAVGVGEAVSDGRGIVSSALTHAFRLLNAEPLKEAVARAETGIAVIVSRRVYEDVVHHGRGLVDPGDYYRVEVSVKETSDEAWITVPGERPSRGAGVPAVTERGEPAPQEEKALRDEKGSRDGWPLEDGSPPMAADVSPAQMFRVVDDLLDIPRFRAERGRDQLVGALSADIAGAVARSGEARADLYAIVQTCLDYPGGLQEFLQVVRGFVGESMAVRRLEQTIARLLLPPQDGDWA